MIKVTIAKIAVIILCLTSIAACKPLSKHSSNINESSFPKLGDFDRSTCESISFMQEYEYNDIVVIAELYPSETEKPDIIIKAVDFYKGRGIDIIGIDPGLDLEPGIPYLIFAKKVGQYYFVDPCSRSNRLDRVSEEDKKILFEEIGVVCVDQVARKNGRNAICTREYVPVCGCDGNTYGNSCEADAAGVVKYTSGICANSE